MPAVTVIMPAYNVAPYITAAIDSVCAQTFTDFELLVVDDGSTDATHAIAKARAARDKRVCVIQRMNGGISAARNEGLQWASGGVIAILDSDDLWAPAFLAEQMAILDSRRDVDIVTGNAWFLGGTFDGQAARPFPDPRPAPDLSTIIADELAVFIMSVFRRRVYDTIGGFDESLRTNEDYDYWLRSAAAGFRFARNDTPLAQYRRRDDSLSADEARMLRGVLRVLDKTRPALVERPVELAILERKATEFESRCLAVEAGLAIEARDFPTAAARLAALRSRSGGPRIRLASVMARWTPGLLARVYHLRRGLQGAAP
jgi:glycosyltransferase involved in cell wall biosynthesis